MQALIQLATPIGVLGILVVVIIIAIRSKRCGDRPAGRVVCGKCGGEQFRFAPTDRELDWSKPEFCRECKAPVGTPHNIPCGVAGAFPAYLVRERDTTPERDDHA